MPRILVADDDAEVRDALVRYLRLHVLDAEIDEAINGNFAISKLRHAETPYDLLITDYRMPMTDGIGVLKALQGSDMETHAILLTGDPPTRQFMEEQGLEGVAVIRKADLHKLNEYLSNTLGVWYMKNAKKR